MLSQVLRLSMLFEEIEMDKLILLSGDLSVEVK